MKIEEATGCRVTVRVSKESQSHHVIMAKP